MAFGVGKCRAGAGGVFCGAYFAFAESGFRRRPYHVEWNSLCKGKGVDWVGGKRVGKQICEQVGWAWGLALLKYESRNSAPWVHEVGTGHTAWGKRRGAHPVGGAA